MCKYWIIRTFLSLILFTSCSSRTLGQDVADALDAEAYASAAADREDLHLRINHASEDDLASFPTIGVDGAKAVAARRAGRQIRSLKELADLLNWTQEESDLMEPVLDFSTKSPRGEGKTVLRVTSGPPWSSDARLLTRSTFQKNGLSGAIVTERDPGEQSVVDHHAGYLELKHPNGLTLLFGDFRPGFGVGLVYARQARSSVESAHAGVTRRTRLGTSGSDENGALRGVSLLVPARFGKLLLAYSRSSWDAVIGETASLRLSGDHSGDTGRSAANQLSEETRLARFEIGSRAHTLGWTWSHSEFSSALTFDGITGKHHSHLGIDGATQFRQNWLYGELAGNAVSGSTAYTRGHAVALGWRRADGPLRIDLRARTLSPEYVSIRYAPPSAYGGGNEWGVSTPVRFRSRRGFILDGFLDRHGTHHPPQDWPTLRKGTRSRLSLTQIISPRLTLEARIASIQERSQRRETRDRFGRGLRLRTRFKASRARFTVWAERVSGHNPVHAVAHALGADFRLSLGWLVTDLWASRSRSTGTAARIYGFRPEAWGGRSVVTLPSEGWASTFRLTTKGTHVKAALVTHLAPTRRFALQIDLTM